MNINILGTIVITTVSLNAVADGPAYWVGSDGNYARGGFGDCVRTINWTPEKAIADCESGAVKAALAKDDADAMAAKAKAEADARAKAAADARAKAAADARAKAQAAADARAKAAANAAPQYRNLSLSSGATFKLGGSTLSAEGKAAVLALLADFKGESIKSVVVEGHTDDRGPAAFNQQLSEKRAQAVKQELIANGVNASVIKTVGYGESRPVADNNSRDGRAKNRRVDVKIDAQTRQL